MWPTIVALRRLGGAATADEISAAVIEAGSFTDGHDRSMIDHRLAWARNYLRNIGAIENNARDMWSLAAPGRALTEDEIPAWMKLYAHRCSV